MQPQGPSKLAMVLVALASVLVPLSLCVVPSLARLTVFPLLSAIVHKVAAAYLQPCLSIEFLFGSFPARAHRQAPGAAPLASLRGVTIDLFAVKVQQEFLKTLAFAKQGLAPLELTAVNIKRMTIHMATTWKIIVNISELTVDGIMVDTNAAELRNIEDAVAMKLGEAGGLVGKLVAEKLKRETQKQQDERLHASSTSLALSSTPPAFSFKDRVVQLVAAQIDVHVDDFKVNVSSCENSEVTEKPTRVTFGVDSFDLITDVKHESLEEALELVLTSSDIRVEYSMFIKGMTLSSPLRRGDESLMHFEGFELKLEVPPMPRLLGIVENIAPIPAENRYFRVEHTGGRKARGATKVIRVKATR